MDLWAGLLKPLLPGAIGAALAACLGRRNGKLHMMLCFCVGFAFSTFTTEPVMHYFKLDPLIYVGGIGFILGFFGMSLCSRILSLIYSTDWKAVIEKRLG